MTLARSTAVLLIARLMYLSSIRARLNRIRIHNATPQALVVRCATAGAKRGVRLIVILTSPECGRCDPCLIAATGGLHSRYRQ